MGILVNMTERSSVIRELKNMYRNGTSFRYIFFEKQYRDPAEQDDFFVDLKFDISYPMGDFGYGW